MNEQAEYTYDLFISYADADRAWVEGYLLDALTQAGVRCHSEAAFALGVPRLLEFEHAIRQSQRILLVLSPAYLTDDFSQFADLLAQSYGLETGTWPVIPLILEHVDQLPLRLRMLTRLDATDPDQWLTVIANLCAELQRPVPGPAPRPPCPYLGMRPFLEEESCRFYGREQEIEALLHCLRLHPFVAIVGPSGCGKSSLVFAGLVPALRKSGLFGPGEWMVSSLHPGEHPLAALAEALSTDSTSNPGQPASELLSTQPDAKHLLLIVDQFEELFTLAQSNDRAPFQEALQQLVKAPDCYVILTARADFYPELMATPLWPEIQKHRYEVSPLDDDGLAQAIVKPADDIGVYVETALVERLVRDAEGEPGILPLLQETLVLLWEKVERRYLPLRAYEALVLPRSAYGSQYNEKDLTALQVAIALHADATLADLFTEQEAIARRIFVRLVQFGEGRADTRRQQSVTELRAATDAPALFDQILSHLTGRRLLTLSGKEEDVDKKVDIAHEALIGAWPKLQEWLDQRRDAERIRRRLVSDVEEWKRKNRDGFFLYEGTRLEQAQEWAAENKGELDKDLREFLAASGRREVKRRRVQLFVRAVIVLFALIGILSVVQFTRLTILRFSARGPMVTFAAGPARLGTDNDPELRGYPQRTVKLPAFSLDVYEVTNGQYRLCVQAGACSRPLEPADALSYEEADERLPVVWVTAYQAAKFCDWIGRRLPTEAEWERAVRGTEGRPWPWGDEDPTPTHVNLFLDNYFESAPTGLVPVDDSAFANGATPEGIMHLLGNAREWTSTPTMCDDPYDCPMPWNGKSKVPGLYLSGLSWSDDLAYGITDSLPAIPNHFDGDIGFRCARSD